MSDTRHHPKDTKYDVLIPGHAARCRGLLLRPALKCLRTFRTETPDCILVAYFPDGSRETGCTGSWEGLDGSVTMPPLGEERSS
jgi:hypothetical protein